MRNLKRTLSLALSATMLSSMMVAGAGAASYADVSSNHHQEAIAVMQAVGVMVGDENGNFNPDKQVTRAEMAVVMSNLLGLKVEDFKNAPIPFTDVPEWARPYVAACYAAGVTSGTSADTFGPDAAVTRAQAVTFQWRAAGSPVVSGSSFDDVAADAYYANAVAWAVANGITSGTGGSNFSPDVVVTRAQAVTFLWKELA